MTMRRIAAVFGLLVTGACSGSTIDVGPAVDLAAIRVRAGGLPARGVS